MKNIRNNKGLTQQALAESLGLRRTSVTNIEKALCSRFILFVRSIISVSN
ncbi:helix-turn-helix domain-containing protein [Filobacillus milosensis]